jgi:hypothetical protein
VTGEQWLETDPWWQDKPPPRLRFTAEGGMDAMTEWPVLRLTGAEINARRWRFVNRAAGRTGTRSTSARW